MLTNINRVSVDSIGNKGSQDLSLFSDPSVSPQGRFADEPSVSFSFSSHTTNLVPRESNNTLDVFVSDTSKMSDVSPPLSATGIVYNRIIGLPSNDTLIGTSNEDYMNGQEGNDVLIGLKGNDIFEGSQGNDIVYGGKGSDILNDPDGDNTLVGGAGRDTFSLYHVFEPGINTILDFTNSEDMLELGGFTNTFEELLILPSTNGILITVARSGQVLASLIGVAPNLIGPEDFLLPPPVIYDNFGLT